MTGTWAFVPIASLLFGAALVDGGTVIDQIAITVDKHAIKTSDIDRDLRVTQFLNGQTPDVTAAQRREAAQRLIDQQLIRDAIVQAGSSVPLTDDAKGLLNQIRSDRFKGSDSLMTAELHRRGLSNSQLLEQLQWQLEVLHFIDERFRSGVLITDQDVRAYYDQHASELKEQYPQKNTLEELTPRIRELLEGDAVNRDFEDWLAQTRKTSRIDYKLDGLK